MCKYIVSNVLYIHNAVLLLHYKYKDFCYLSFTYMVATFFQHLSIHYSIFTTYPVKGHRGAEVSPSYHWARDVMHPGQIGSLSQGHTYRQKTTHTHIHTYRQFRVTNKPDPFLDCGRKPEHPQETHADTGRMCSTQKEKN